ncbi:RNA polymerase sigma factor [Rhizobium mesoamericanum]|uniref:RNA polymerase sigma factor protein (Sigma-24) n=1 Tax=Rhizobium mesoamericanum STM3625 TaxID=1211777 RepID=K0Q277_9HYPH|nr:RNA polymerase sigma factor [Rhizobium mesoamericanum]CCM76579.1 RNA polymerase sigma factor protein (Sigma-24) [Rhizobium mesoamericanum STM3625]
MRQPVTTIDIRRDLVGLLPRLRRFAMTLAGDAVSADELAQAACERAISKSNQWNGEGRLESWVYTLARQHWSDDHRRRKPHPAAKSNVTDIRQANRDRISLVEPDVIHRMIADMPEGTSSTFLLVVVEGHSYQQAADIMGVTINIVVSQLAAARLHFASVSDNYAHRY